MKIIYFLILSLASCNLNSNSKYMGKWQEFNRVDTKTGKNVNNNGIKFMTPFKFEIQKKCIIDSSFIVNKYDESIEDNKFNLGKGYYLEIIYFKNDTLIIKNNSDSNHFIYYFHRVERFDFNN